MIEPAVRLLLVNNDPARLLIEDRAFLGASPQNERRARVVITRPSTVFGRTHDSTGPSYTRGRVQLDCLAPTYPEAKALAQAVSKVVDQFSTDVGEGDARHATAGEIRQQLDLRVHLIEVDDEADIPVMPHDGKSTPTFGVRIEARFLCEEHT